jgi:primosomal replication protein N
VAHTSLQPEAGGERRVDLEIDCIAVEALARVIGAAPLGTGVSLHGFLAPKGRSGRSTRHLLLHVTDIEFREKE